jgi:hypothetical protein
MFIATITNWAFRLQPIARPTIRCKRASSTMARYRNPAEGRAVVEAVKRREHNYFKVFDDS